MQNNYARPPRQDSPRRAPNARRGLRFPLRWAAALALLAAFFGGTAAAQAATGGATVTAPAATTPAGIAGAEGGEIAFTPFRRAAASWYGPGLYGRRTACGVTLHRHTLGVANRYLPCGTTVKFAYRGHTLITRVIDRGPFVKGRSWDLTAAASQALDLEGVGRVRYALAIDLARHRLRH